ncbi:MAG: hypothetical protein H0U79_06255 [Solirubrobacterales bacterium]|nr:hypothetical protein [Solirubrobacterales bacterium]
MVENTCATGGSLRLAMQPGLSYTEGVGRNWSWSPAVGTSLQSLALRRAFTLAGKTGDITPMEIIYSGARDLEKHSHHHDGVTSQGLMSTWNGTGKLDRGPGPQPRPRRAADVQRQPLPHLRADRRERGAVVRGDDDPVRRR